MFHVSRLISFFCVIGLFLIVLISPQKSLAATFNVNSTTDAVDANIGNGTCATSGSVCTLRAAVQEANALAGADTINVPAGTYTFSITGTDEDISATGDLDITSTITITGTGASSTIIDGARDTITDRIFDIRATGNLTFSGLTLQNAGGGDFGAGIQNQGTLTASNSTVDTAQNTGIACGLCNHGGSGGGIANLATMTLTNVTVSNNTAGSGGGVYNSGTATLDKVTVHGNTSDLGAGIYNDSGGTLTLTNVTISGNAADRTTGGGIYADTSTLTTTNVTIYNNTAISGAGGIETSGVTSQVRNTILASNTGGSGNCTGSLTSLGYNLSSDSSCNASFNSTGDLNSTNPILVSSLELNGGVVRSHALESTSPAIDTGTNTGCPSTDTAGTSRPKDGDNNGTATCDIGAYEYVYPTPGPPNPGGPPPGCTLTPPARTLGVFVSVISNSSVRVQWYPSTNASEAHIRYTDTLGVWRYSLLNTANDGREIISSLNPIRTYYFQVAGVNGCAVGQWSDTFGPVSLTTSSPTPTPTQTPGPEQTTEPFASVSPTPSSDTTTTPTPVSVATVIPPIPNILPIGTGLVVIIPIAFLIAQALLTLFTLLEAVSYVGEISIGVIIKLIFRAIISPLLSLLSLIWIFFLGHKRKYNITGQIINQNNRHGIEGASIVFRKDRSHVHITMSNWQGKFRLFAPPGVYKIYVTKPGFSMLEVASIIVTDKSTTEAILDMKPVDEKDIFKVALYQLYNATRTIYRVFYPLFVIVVLGLAIYVTILEPTISKKIFLGLFSIYSVFFVITSISENVIEKGDVI